MEPVCPFETLEPSWTPDLNPDGRRSIFLRNSGAQLENWVEVLKWRQYINPQL
jgi:hypothetical protein